MLKIFGLFAVPLGYILRWVCGIVPNYLIAIFLFTLLMKLLLFPLNISSQKGAADRARLAPRLERIQKKYANDRKKMAEKQQELYDKEGVKMTAGCLPQILQMLVLFSIIAVIYKPLTYVERIDAGTLQTSAVAVADAMEQADPETAAKGAGRGSVTNQLKSENSYYRELYLLKYMDDYTDNIRTALVDAGKTADEADAVITTMKDTKADFHVFGISLLGVPSETGILPNWLWVIAILSGVTALLTSLLSMRTSQMGMTEQQQQMGGCSTKSMMFMMPLFSLVISFTVPAGVAVYWIFSNLLALVQTTILNKMYNPAKIRAQAELEYAERRRKKAEDKERLKQARLQEQAAWQREENEKRAAKEGKRPPQKESAEITENKDAPDETEGD